MIAQQFVIVDRWLVLDTMTLLAEEMEEDVKVKNQMDACRTRMSGSRPKRKVPWFDFDQCDFDLCN